MDTTLQTRVKRRSIRKYRDKRGIPWDTIRSFLRAAMSAMPAYSQQPWHFIRPWHH